MSRRSRAREIALQALFQEDLNPQNSLEDLGAFLAARLQDEPSREFAKQLVMGLIADAGYAPVDLGRNEDAAVIEAPRRPGAVYGEEYRLRDAEKVVEAVRAGEEIPPTPSYS